MKKHPLVGKTIVPKAEYVDEWSEGLVLKVLKVNKHGDLYVTIQNHEWTDSIGTKVTIVHDEGADQFEEAATHLAKKQFDKELEELLK